jgi:hypothetical protein
MSMPVEFVRRFANAEVGNQSPAKTSGAGHDFQSCRQISPNLSFRVAELCSAARSPLFAKYLTVIPSPSSILLCFGNKEFFYR